MPEQTIWRGPSSQWKNFGRYLLSGLLGAAIVAIFSALRNSNSAQVSNLSPSILLILVVPIFIALARYLKTKNKIYELTSERVKISEGVFSKVTDTLELYRVKDLETRQPFLYRLVSIENVQLNTSDASSPFILIEAIPCVAGLADKIRNQVEAIRSQKDVREIDVE